MSDEFGLLGIGIVALCFCVCGVGIALNSAIRDVAAALEKRVEDHWAILRDEQRRNTELERRVERIEFRLFPIDKPKPERVRMHMGRFDGKWEECIFTGCGYNRHATFERVEE